MRASVPSSLFPRASWATPRFGPMIRMADSLIHHAARAPGPAARGRRCTPTGGMETVVAVGTPSRADGTLGAWLRPWPTTPPRLVPVTVLVCV